MLGALLAGGQALYGAYNAYKSGQEASDYQAKLERLARQSPLKQENPELANYYQQALNRYNENPFTTSSYLESVKQANRASANAIGAMQSRGAAIGSIGKIDQGVMDNSNRAIGNAIQNKNQQFSQLGSATQMRKNEADQMFDINQMTPYNRVLQLQQLKAQAANSRYNAGLNMLAQGVGTTAQLNMADKYYNKDNNKVDNNQGGFLSGLKSLFGKNISTDSNPATTLPSSSNYTGTQVPSYFNYGNNQTNSYGLQRYKPKIPKWNPATGTYD
jgi:hypothetical protein